MKSLEEKIEKEGLVLPGNVLKVDSFLNHQIDPVMTMAMGRELIRLFSGVKIDRVLTVEASGIAIGLAAAYYAGAPLVFAKKKKSVLMTEEAYTADVYSYTKKETNTIAVLKSSCPGESRCSSLTIFLPMGKRLSAWRSWCARRVLRSRGSASLWTRRFSADMTVSSRRDTAWNHWR